MVPDTSQPAVAAPVPASAASAQSMWTPELRIQAFKEGVSAVLGVLLVAFTVSLAVLAVGAAGNAAKSTDTREVLTLMLGLSGVVLGYYFGRVPAEGQAAQARKEASDKVAGAIEVSACADSLMQAVDQLQVETTTRGSDGREGKELDDLRRRRDELRSAVNAMVRR
jgi:hypothetical protein